jgi:elongation factor 2
VCFGSGYFGWAFSITTFAKIYAEKFGIKKEKMMEKLWGDNYFDPKASVWKNVPQGKDGSTLNRCFVQFVMAPIIKLCNAAMEGNLATVQKMAKNLNIKLKADELEL